MELPTPQGRGLAQTALDTQPAPPLPLTSVTKRITRGEPIRVRIHASLHWPVISLSGSSQGKGVAVLKAVRLRFE